MGYNPTLKPLTSILTSQRSTTGTYVNAAGQIATAAIDTARIDWSEGTAALLIEAAATNLITRSAASSANWTNQSATLTNKTDAAFGVFPGLLVASTGSASDRAQAAGVLHAGATDYTVTAWYASGTSAQIALQVSLASPATSIKVSGAPGALAVSGTVSGGTVSGVTNRALGGGRYSVSVTYRVTAAVTLSWGMGPNSATVGETMTAYAMQLETGTTATSYIPTSGTTVTRAADICSLDVTPLGLAAGFTIAVKGTVFGTAGVSGIVANFDSGAYDNRQIIVLNSTGSGLGAQAFAGGVSQASTFTAYTPGTPFAAAMRVGPNVFRYVLNASVGADDTSVDFVPPTILRIGGSLASQIPARLRLKSVLLYPALVSDAALTALGTV
ncbi:phage head spike fiber domain-containing protein [Phaeovulum sp. W22_SRMD_FR3]|uniref:phage head spike fiber domain-containing protein n=1 Tax=Phaeovulum sp. W22_SRMD_FR3 TaxID=3240274 RepID=UPI003F9BA839